jgi:hypothetical protein
MTILKSDIRLEKALTSISELVNLSKGRRGAVSFNTLGAGDYGQHIDYPSPHKSKKAKKEEEERLHSK